jgi:hypothetical protein
LQNDFCDSKRYGDPQCHPNPPQQSRGDEVSLHMHSLRLWGKQEDTFNTHLKTKFHSKMVSDLSSSDELD